MSFSIPFHQAADYLHQSLSSLKDVDWLNEIRLVVTASLLAGVIVTAGVFIPQKYPNLVRRLDLTQYIDIEAILPQSARTTTSPRRTYICPPPRSPYDWTRRTVLGDTDVCIFAWPSKGGVIILDHADAIDFEFLGLDPLNPPANRLSNQTDEDNFCQRLLLLGAKWWDSEARSQFLARADEMDDRAIQALEDETEPIPTMRERRYVSVGWPTTGGLWVAEFDTTLWGIEEEENLVPSDAARLKLARTMDERCQILRDRFHATFYNDVRDYKGYAFLNGWEEKETGEVGPLMQQKLAK